MAHIVICYRRADSGGYAGRLYDKLTGKFDKLEIFRDVDTIKPGDDYVKAIKKAIGSCDALIAVIGPRWLDILDDKGRRRLDNPNDCLRLEIASALKRNIRVIPVLVGGARMASQNNLPDDLVALTRHNTIEISDDHFSYDIDRLIDAIGGAYGTVQVLPSSGIRSIIEARLQNWSMFEVYIDLTRQPEEFGAVNGTMHKVKAGMHNIQIRYNPTAWNSKLFPDLHRKQLAEKSIVRNVLTQKSNTLYFKIKGGQSIYFTFGFESTFPAQQSKLVIKPFKPLIEP